ncbi:3-deoxy-D-manno-octulosonic acid transferase [Gelidibacter salicanalis]|uniref:3-deoxy-D-manno-octulosonic acid transferase n=1 Tax=Gelidibacter salicanalis TaxID=291193 RepID=A0A5C7AEE6_9FLAO|nr:glycosyltransferase N-terminal domain-containing protein [Gelidibacter salicanalis]TXE06791.1 3-deoxy-D-manno-octulosonic acid transferase [Gelidibacter salicanalis]
MKLLYNIALHTTEVLLKILGLFNDKIKAGVLGRGDTFKLLASKIKLEDKTLWFHCASLGEYEQGLPIFKKLRADYPNHKIVLSFFSPSGYEIRKNTAVADVVVYLPMDTSSNAKRFVTLLKPELTIFVKYEVWPNYMNALKQYNLRTILISAVFRADQPYFKFYGGIMRDALGSFDHIFVQHEASQSLLNSIGFTKVTVAGDTRYDRVSDQLLQDNTLTFIEQFKADQLCIVVGSSWPEDESLFIEYLNKSQVNLKVIIAPHNIKDPQIAHLKSQLKKKTVLFSEKDGHQLADYELLIIDTIGLLSKIYSYADIAYVGGAMGSTGLHNILEPAVFGAPIIIGKNYTKFPEAFQMIAHGGVQAIENGYDLQLALNTLINNSEKRARLGTLNADFIKTHQGAVIQIMDYIRK